MSPRKKVEQQQKRKVCGEDLEQKKKLLFLLKRENARRIAAEKTRMFGTKLLTHSQQMVIQLRATKESLITDITNAGCKRNVKIYKRQALKIEKLLKEMDKNKQKISYLKTQRSEIDDQCKKIAKVVYQKQLQNKAIFGNRQTQAQLEKKVSNMENTLYHITTRTNLQFVKIRDMREDIHNQMIHRDIYYKRMSFVMNETKRDAKKLRRVMNKTKRNFSDRDELISQRKTIQEHEHKEILHHQSDITEIGRVQADEAEYENFIVMKNRERSSIEDEHYRKMRILMEKEDAILNEIQFCVNIAHKLIDVTGTNNIYLMIQMLKHHDNHHVSDVANLCQLSSDVNEAFEDLLLLKKEMEQDVINIEHLEFQNLLEFKGAEMELKIIKRDIEKIDAEDTNDLKNKHAEDAEDFLSNVKWVLNKCKIPPKVIAPTLGKLGAINMGNVNIVLKALEDHFKMVKRRLRICEIKEKREKEGIRYYRHYDRTRFPFKNFKSRGGPYKPKLTFIRKNEDTSEEDEDKGKFIKEEMVHPLDIIDAKLEVLDEIEEKGVQAMGLSTQPSYMGSRSSDSY